MENYENKIVVVAGGTGGVGEGIVKAFVDRGATVIVPSRTVNARRESHLKDYLGDKAGYVHLIEGDISDEEGAKALRQQVVAEFGNIDAMVASLGGWWEGTHLVDLDIKTWDYLLNTNLTSHFVAAKTFMPILKQGGSYTFIAGFSAAQAYPGAGPIAVAGAGQLMLRQMFSAEQKNIRVNDFILGPINTRKRGSQYQDPSYLSPEDVGRFAGFLAFEEGSGVTNSTITLNEKKDVEAQLEKIKASLES